jgi:Protein of unknown function (DUF3455)
MKNQFKKTSSICLMFAIAFSVFVLSSCNKEDNLIQSSVSENAPQVVTADKQEPVVPTDLEVPAGNHLVHHVYARGFQIYRCTVDANGAHVWSFVAPDAILYANAGYNGQTGTHYAGPIWESNSGSMVRGAVDKIVPSPDPNAVPWLLLHAVSSSGPGIFKDVTFIQRLNTYGGKAPTTVCDAPGTEVRIPYTAEYYFYKAH